MKLYKFLDSEGNKVALKIDSQIAIIKYDDKLSLDIIMDSDHNFNMKFESIDRLNEIHEILMKMWESCE